jgi:hypothetical protein
VLFLELLLFFQIFKGFIMIDNNQNDGLVEYVLEQMFYNETWLSVAFVVDGVMILWVAHHFFGLNIFQLLGK